MDAVTHKRYVVHPYKFNLWIAIISILMMFAAFTSAYVVKRGDVKYWQDIHLPAIFYFSTGVILMSSLSMHAAYRAFRSNRLPLYRGLILLTFLLGVSFVILQINGWIQLTHSGIYLNGNVAGSFIYVISGAHLLHAVGGVIALLVFSILAFSKYKSPIDTLEHNIQPRGQLGVELMMTYWHFVDILWLYLFIFFNIYN